MVDSADVNKVVALAEGAFAKAADRFQLRDNRLRPLLIEAEAALAASRKAADDFATSTAPDRQQLASAAIVSATTALDNSNKVIDELQSAGDLKDEWKECRSTIDRFDKLLVDLRKTGFGFVTAVVGASTFVFTQSTPGVKVSIFCMLALLIVTLYLIDCVHQVWLKVTVHRAMELEALLNFRLSTNIVHKFEGSDADILGLWLYIVLLTAACAIFLFAMPEAEHITGGHRMTIYAAYLTALIAMGVSLGWHGIQEFMHRHKLWVRIVGILLALLAAGFIYWLEIS
jgi:hypothetical protein